MKQSIHAVVTTTLKGVKYPQWVEMVNVVRNPIGHGVTVRWNVSNHADENDRRQ